MNSRQPLDTNLIIRKNALNYILNGHSDHADNNNIYIYISVNRVKKVKSKKMFYFIKMSF